MTSSINVQHNFNVLNTHKKYLWITALASCILMLYFILSNSASLTKAGSEIAPAPVTPQPNKLIAPMKKDSLREYSKLHYESIVVDSHNDFIWQVYDKGATFNECSFTQSDLPRFRSGGVDVQFFAVWIPMKEVKNSFSFVKGQIKRLNQIEQENSGDIEFAKSYEDIMSILAKKKICGLIGVEGGTAIENNLDNINKLYDMGVRYIGLTWNNSNLIGSSAKDETEKGKKGGLTDFGKKVIERMNELGMLIDVAHLGENSFWDVYNLSTQPVFSSHSNAYAINPHFRNLTDEQIQAIAKSGGVIQVNFYDEFLDKNAKRNRTKNAYQLYRKELDELNEKYGDNLEKYNEERDKFLKEKKLTGGTTLDKVIEHIDYIKNLVGADYVGLGSDFDGGISPPAELYDASCYPMITKKLIEKGYSDEEIKKILGLNILRLFKQVCK
ncbi:MAG: dipeptidase [Ignavibacteria bacterium]|nr:dipeptidase [Ignavibacteria bacterium]